MLSAQNIVGATSALSNGITATSTILDYGLWRRGREKIILRAYIGASFGALTG